MRIGSPVIRKVILRNICRIDNRLCRKKIQFPERGDASLLILVFFHIKDDGILPGFQMRFQLCEHFQFPLRVFIPYAGRFCRLGDSAFQNLQIRKNQLQIYGINIPLRIHRTIYVDHIRILKTANHMNNGVTLPDVGKELVAQTFSLRGTLYKPRDIHKLHHGRRYLFRMIEIPQKLQPEIRNRNHTDIRVDGTERIIRHLRACLGQRIKQGTFPDIREPDDS